MAPIPTVENIMKQYYVLMDEIERIFLSVEHLGMFSH